MWNQTRGRENGAEWRESQLRTGIAQWSSPAPKRRFGAIGALLLRYFVADPEWPRNFIPSYNQQELINHLSYCKLCFIMIYGKYLQIIVAAENHCRRTGAISEELKLQESTWAS